jgi:sec-independent protein translocase protein TatA
MPFSPFELLIIVFIVLLLFGAKRVPDMSRSLGSSLREFKDGITSFGSDDEPERKALDRGETRVDATDRPRSARTQ